MSPEPLSFQAVGFAVSKPLAEVARNQRKVVLTKEDRERAEHEAAENPVTRSTATGTFTWGQGNDTVFPSRAGAPTSYASVNFQSTTGTNDISNWLIMPTMTLRDGNKLIFWTRTTDVGANLFPDRLQVRMSLNGASTNTGDTIHLTGAGSCTVTAHQAGDASFNAAPGVSRAFNTLSAVLNLSMTADRNPAPVELNMNYKPVITNTGNAPATNVVLTDVLPSLVTLTAATTSQGSCSYDLPTKTVTCNLGTIAPSSTVNVQITVKPRNQGTLNNTATITGGQWDPATGNASASVNGIPAIKYVDLSVQKTNTPDPIFVGQNTVFTIVVKNNSTVLGATGVVMSDLLPVGMTFVSATTSQGSLITPPVGSTGIVTAKQAPRLRAACSFRSRRPASLA